MRTFYHNALIILAFLLFLTPARAEETRFVPQVDMSVILTETDVYHAKQWAISRRYEREQEVKLRYYRLEQEVRLKYYNQDHEALKVVRLKANDAYLQWLDAREMRDLERASEIENTTPEFMIYRAEVKKNDRARDVELVALESEQDRHIAEINSVHEAELELIYQAYEQIMARQ